jgi:hypothetical protein
MKRKEICGSDSCADRNDISILIYLDPFWAECLVSSTIKADQQQQLIYSVDNVGHVSCSTSEALAFFWWSHVKRN